MTAKKIPTEPAEQAPVSDELKRQAHMLAGMPEHLRVTGPGPYDETLAWVNEHYLDVPTPQRDLLERKCRALIAMRWEQAKEPNVQREVLIQVLGPLS